MKKDRKAFGYWHNFEHCKEVAKECSGVFEFHEKYRSAYRASKQEGWFDTLYQMFWSPDNWTFEQCQTEAMKYTDRSKFYKYSKLAYKAAKANGWLGKICNHMVDSECYWTYERCKEEFMKYKTKTELFNANEIAYRSALHHGWLEELCSHMIKLRRDKFQKSDCWQTALKYNRIVDFEKNDQAKYNAARKNGWLTDICSHMFHRVKEWTPELLKEEALKYKYKIDFLRGNASAYTVAARLGILDSICSHMEDLGDMYKRAIYAWEFPDNYVYVGLTCNIERRINEHLRDEASQVFRHCRETGLEPTFRLKHEYVPVNQAKRLEGETLKEYVRNGWKKLNAAKTGGIGSTREIYTEDKIRSLARTCHSRKEFMKLYRGAYSACTKKKMMYVLDEIFPKLRIVDAKGVVHNCAFRKWSDEKIWEVAKKYKTYRSICRIKIG